MKLWIVKLWWIYAFLLANCCANGTPLDYADSLFNAQRYERAALAYERLAFMAETEDTKAIHRLRRAQCFKVLGRFDQALQSLQTTPTDLLDDTLHFALRHEIALNLYLLGEYESCVTAISNAAFLLPDPFWTDQLLYLKVLACNESLQYEEAKVAFERYAALHQLRIDIDSCYQLDGRAFKLKKVETAQLLNRIIPGLGQIYAGHVFKGMTNLALVTAGVVYTISSFNAGLWITGFATGIPLGLRFWAGGTRHAAWLVEEKNRKKMAAFNASIREIVLQVEMKKAH